MIFQVSAKTARLIGRENISDVDGAIIELVKNGYDADAECVYVKYEIPYNEIPKKISFSEVKKYFVGREDLLNENYVADDGYYCLNAPEKCQSYDELDPFFRSLSMIIVLDNGTGMNHTILENNWMNIGTDDKEINIYSPIKKRIKTGAKGIGRFALDKLSLQSKVITKCKGDNTYIWEIDWTQFENAKLLNQVNADLSECDRNFESIAKEYLAEDFELVKQFDWTSGTLIVLNPIREFWDEKLYAKVNNNLRNINPFESVDQFKVFVRNMYNSSLDYWSETEGIARENYDYLIDASFDGNGHINITLDRNEIDNLKQEVRFEFSDTDVETYNLDEFWNLEAFKRDKYQRQDFDGRQTFQYSLNEVVESAKEKRIDLDKYNQVGSFSLKMYYLKNQKSTVDIIKDFKSRKRKNLINNFSGIKIYRDNFKVRPYGDYGQFYDWIDLSTRVQKSPAAASHESGNWRVSPNQIIGSVSIGRVENPRLSDNANREGMNSNREYDCFIEIIQGILSKFEYDRQYVLREYATWERSKKKAHEDRVQRIYEQVLREREKQRSKQDNYNQTEKTESDVSEDDLKDAVYLLGKRSQNKVSTEQLMMVLSAAGVMAQTFSHEITRIGTNLGSRGQHLKEAINRMLNYQPYTGDEDFDPYEMIKELDDTDELLSEWVNLIMDSVQKEKFETHMVNMKEFLEHIRNIWMPLLKKKYITFLEIECAEDIEIELPEIDLHLIVNNFILNSAYYLEEALGERKIEIKVYTEEKNIILEMTNNGPKLDEKYEQNPDESLNATESSKENGTGLGLWIAREASIRNAGTLHVVLVEEGYMLRATWVK